MNNKTRRLIQRLTLTPYSVWAVLFIVVPLLFVAYYAFTDQNFHFTFGNISRFFTATSVVDNGETTREVHTYLVIFMRSLKLAVISTAVCLLMGYPLAYIMARASERTQNVLLTLIMIPMWMNFLIRTYAWMTILQDTGILNGFLSALHLGRVHIIGTESAVVIGMVYDYFPYMVLPIYSIMANLRHHHGAHPLHQHLLHLPEARQRQVLPDRRRDRGPVHGQQPPLRRRHRLYPDGHSPGLHGPDAEACQPQARRGMRRAET